MTDNPSSSVPVSKGGDADMLRSERDSLKATLEECQGDMQDCVRRLVDAQAALASQEARHQKDMLMLEDALDTIKARHRQEMEEAKRENERLQASYEAGIRVRRQLEETIRGTDEAHAETSRILGEQRARAEAAEQREREALKERDHWKANHEDVVRRKQVMEKEFREYRGKTTIVMAEQDRHLSEPEKALSEA